LCAALNAARRMCSWLELPAQQDVYFLCLAGGLIAKVDLSDDNHSKTANNDIATKGVNCLLNLVNFRHRSIGDKINDSKSFQLG
jgi:hypothetical protein